MYALFTLIFFIPLFGSDYSMLLSSNRAPTNSLSFETPTLKTGMQCYNQHSSSSTCSSSPLFTVELNNNNQSLTWSQKHNYAHMFPDVTALYRNGHAQDLVKAAADIDIWTYMSNPTLRMRKDYINFLIKGENKEQLMRLARILAIDSPRRMRVELDRFYRETRDPSQRCQAIILADKQTCGNFIPNVYLPKKEYIPADGNPGQFVGRDFLQELKDKAPHAQELIDVELAKYAVERYLPELWAPFTSEIAYQYLQNVIYISERVPSYHQKEVIDWALLGFYSRLTDPKATMRSHKDAVWNVSEKLATAVVKASAGNLKCVPDSIVMLHDDIHWLINDCPREEVAFKTGQRLADSAYIIAYYAGVRQALQSVSCVRAIYLGAETGGATVLQNAGKVAEKLAPEEAALITRVEEIAPQQLADKIVQHIIKEGECQLSKGKGLTHNYACRVKPGQDPSQIIKQLEHFGPLRNIAKDGDKGEVLLRTMNENNKLVYREFSKSFKNAPEPVPTIEYQRGDLSVKLRYAHSEQMFQDILSGKYE